MRVDYILPALEPAITNEGLESRDMVPSFRERVHLARPSLPQGWEQQLRLDTRPFTATYIGPPPRPQTLALDNFQTQRIRWRNLVSRHDAGVDPSHSSITSPSQPAVQAMIEMLRHMQAMEDSIVALQVAITRG